MEAGTDLMGARASSSIRMGRDWQQCVRFSWFALGLLNLFFVTGVENVCSLRDAQALLGLKNESQSSPTALSSWGPNSDCCRGWAGVTCDASGTDVIELRLTGDLQLGGGDVSRNLCNLSELQVVKIFLMEMAPAGDMVEKQLPACVWNMTEIRSLTIETREGVAFQGPVPDQVCTLAHLRHLQVSMEGEIPDCVWGMRKLNFLDVGAANPSQSFPSQICTLGNLRHLAVGKYQEIDGTPVDVVARLAIPNCIWNMTRLEYLRLSGFTLPSSFTADVCNLVNLTFLDVGSTSLYGEFPSCIWSLTKLKHLGVGGQLQSTFVVFGASFSSAICNLQDLSYLSISGLTSLDGYFPDCMWNLTKLEVLRLVDFQLPGLFSSQMCKLTKLQDLQISFNDFTGALPGCFWNMTEIQIVSLIGLDLSNMERPTQLTPSLHQLFLGSTNVTGAFLDGIGNFSALQELDISGNGLASIPNGVQDLHHLYYLDMWGNAITTIPAWLGGMQRLAYLNLSQNAITSLTQRSSHSSVLPLDSIDMASVLSNLTRVETLDLSSNLIKDFPPSLLNLSRLVFLNLSDNFLEKVYLSRQIRTTKCQVCLMGNLIQNVSLRGPGIYNLDLSYNLLNASASLQLNLSGVGYLNIKKNGLRSVPNDMPDSSDLISLTISVNSFETIPPFVSKATNLKWLYFGNNQLRDIWGVCPLEKLALLNVGNNYLGSSQSGVASLACVKNMTRMSKLRFRNNTIQGDLTALMSTMIYNLSELTFLDFFRNNITGNLSSFAGVDLPQLTTFICSLNRLSGEFPASLLSQAAPIGSWNTTGRYVNASNNQLMGRIPEIQGGDGWQVDLSANNLEGPLPSFSNCTLGALLLSGNMLTGSIPPGLEKSSPILQALDLSSNNFTGEMPSYLGGMRSLLALNLMSNNFGGSLPEKLGSCWSLQNLRLSNNSLRGRIPSSIGKALHLRFITISHNSLAGSIPPSLGNCTHLKLLDLSHNNLDGALPSPLKQLSKSLRVFIVSSNRLSGPFPMWIVSFKSLQWLDLSNNSFHGNLPSNFSQLQGFIKGCDAGNNDTIDETVMLTAKGEIPVKLPYLTALRTSFDVSSNYFSGPIPTQLAELTTLKYLTLSRNSFSGTIPSELADLQELESMDLSSNALTGTIPPSLGGIPGLAYFNISNNFLSGPIPTGTQFETFSADLFQNNSGLCSESGISLPPCNQTSETFPPSGSESGSKSDDQDQPFRQWVSLEGFYIGFGVAFFAILVTLIVVGGGATSNLLLPQVLTKWRTEYPRPYGAFYQFRYDPRFRDRYRLRGPPKWRWGQKLIYANEESESECDYKERGGVEPRLQPSARVTFARNDICSSSSELQDSSDQMDGAGDRGRALSFKHLHLWSSDTIYSDR